MLRSRWAWPLAIVLQSLSAQQPAYGQTPQPAPRDSTKAAKDTTQHHSKWRFIHRNEIETPFFTFRLGGAVLMDYAMYSQDSASRAQLAPKDEPDPPSEPPERIMP